MKMRMKIINNSAYSSRSGFKLFMFLVVALFATIFISVSAYADNAASEEAAGENSSQVLKGFNQDRSAPSEIVSIPDERKRLVMFVMGVPLLILIILTVALGIAMVVFGKQVFVAHMICAGLSLTLALGHAIVGMVWFFPF